ncbi:MAG TPA: FAD-dependent oxidoreductase, partial [Hymenobacter sp.]
MSTSPNAPISASQETPTALYDCAIIGGGVAGLTLALQLAQAGRKVVLFEKEKYPFHRVCGEYISMENYDFLCRIGLPLAEMDLPKMTRFTVSSPTGEALHHPLDIGGLGITRYVLDQLLAWLAAEHGATIREGTKVTDVVFADDEFTITVAGGATYRARTACGAWGKHANLDSKLQRPFLEPSRQGR